jgi:hypothetical protein
VFETGGAVLGDSDPKCICTSIVERQNLTIRMQVRRLTRLTNAFSKKWENLWAAYCLHFAYYNLCRVHKTLRVTPAMESGITNHIWTIRELLGYRMTCCRICCVIRPTSRWISGIIAG